MPHFEDFPKGRGQYQVVLCDPPWPYDYKRNIYGGGATYRDLTLDQIKELPVGELCDPSGSLLFLWATSPKLPEALDVLRAWGFTYCCVVFCWIKTRGDGLYSGLGNYSRSNVELVLLGRKGRAPRVRSRTVKQLVLAPVGRHSSKPDCVRAHIDDLLGRDARRIELFARYGRDSANTEGWDSWGDGGVGAHRGLGRKGLRGEGYVSPHLDPEDVGTWKYTRPSPHDMRTQTPAEYFGADDPRVARMAGKGRRWPAVKAPAGRGRREDEGGEDDGSERSPSPSPRRHRPDQPRCAFVRPNNRKACQRPCQDKSRYCWQHLGGRLQASPEDEL